MTDLVIAIPLTLTASQIIRGSPKAISDPEALELARELHDLIGEVQARFVYVKRPQVGGGFFDDGGAAFALADLVDAVRAYCSRVLAAQPGRCGERERVADGPADAHRRQRNRKPSLRPIPAVA